MNDIVKPMNMGVIICRHCNAQVDTVDTDRIATFYGVCDQPECREQHRRLDVPAGVIDEE